MFESSHLRTPGVMHRSRSGRKSSRLWLGLLVVLMLIPAWGVQAQVIVEGPITASTVWSSPVYHVIRPLFIEPGVTLTIAPGTVVKAGAVIEVRGTLNAQGTDSGEGAIRFTSIKDDNIAGDTGGDGPSVPMHTDWGGIDFRPGSTGILRFCEVWFGGGTQGLVRADAASPEMEDCVLNAGFNGMYCENGASPQLTRTTINACEGAPVAMTLDCDPRFDSLSLGSTRDNGYDAIGILGRDIEYDATLIVRSATVGTKKSANVPYVLLAPLGIEEDWSLTIEAGVIVKAAADTWIHVDGTLSATGTDTERIVFTSVNDDGHGDPADTQRNGTATAPAAGDWGGIYYGETASGNLTFCEIAYAAGSLVDVASLESNVWIHDCEFHHGEHGIDISGPSTTALHRNTIRNCDGAPLRILPGAQPALVDNQIEANGVVAVGLLSAAVDTTATLDRLSFAGYDDITYWVEGTVVVDSMGVLTIEPGITLEFDNEGSGILVYGQILASGSPELPINFTSVHDDCTGNPVDAREDGWSTGPCVSDWRSVRVEGSTPSVFEYCHFRFGGAGCSGVLEVGRVAPTVRNCTFYFNAIGVLARQPDMPLATKLGPDLRRFDGNEFGWNGIQSVTYIHGTFTRDYTLNKPRYGGYYVVDDPLIIPFDVTVTIADGVDMAMEPSAAIEVAGALITLEDNLITDPDDPDLRDRHPGGGGGGGPGGPPSSPSGCDYVFGCDILAAVENSRGCAPGLAKKNLVPSWQGIFFENESSDLRSDLRGTMVRYAVHSIEIEDASPRMTRVEIAHGARNGLRLLGNSHATLDSSVIRDCAGTPVSMSIAADLAATGNRFVNNGYQAIGLVGEQLTGDFVLRTPSIAQVRGWPFAVFDDLGVGPEARLTIEPGVVMKFAGETIFQVESELIARGSSDSGAAVVFTSLADDSYGGDTNRDGRSEPTDYDTWGGLHVTAGANASALEFENAVFAYVGRQSPATNDQAALTINGTHAVSIRSSRFLHNSVGLRMRELSTAVIDSSDFFGNRLSAVDNSSFGGDVVAENCWWGGNSGPLDEQDDTAGGGWYNPIGDGDPVSSGVDYEPWIGDGAIHPVLGDVTRNGTLSALDASHVLRHLVGDLTLDATAAEVADVSCAEGVSTLDATFILQWITGALSAFPCDMDSVATRAVGGAAQLVAGVKHDAATGVAWVEIEFDSANPVHGLHLALQGAGGAQALSASLLSEQEGVLLAHNRVEDVLHLALACAEPLVTGSLLHIPLRSASDVDLASSLRFLRADGDGEPIDVVWRAVESFEATIPGRLSIDQVLPNPFNPSTSIHFRVPASTAGTHTRVVIHDTAGRTVVVLVDAPLPVGPNEVQWNGNDAKGRAVGSGVYLCRVVHGDQQATRKMTLLK